MQTNNKNSELWELARKRAGFKSHLIVFLGMIPFFWMVWLTNGQHLTHSGFPWPIFPTAGWGVGLLFHFLGVYVFHGYTLVEREYERLVRSRKP